VKVIHYVAITRKFAVPIDDKVEGYISKEV